ncbi:MAG: hypothetical protein ACI83P_000147 [Janthinobacterium sp.]|jgi:uncharacterized protein YigA (DUF484 family)
MTTTPDATTVAQYLTDHPHFFDEHPALLSELRLASPLTGRALSLQERQMEVMREKYKVLELHLSSLTRTAQDNAALADKFHGWTQVLLQQRAAGDLPGDLIAALKSEFNLPHATLRLWNVDSGYQQTWFTQDVSEDVKLFANSLTMPYCGRNHDFEAVRWTDAPAAITSTAILPLRLPATGGAFGLLVFGSPDPERYTSGMATDFLVHIGATASAALSSLAA